MWIICKTKKNTVEAGFRGQEPQFWKLGPMQGGQAAASRASASARPPGPKRSKRKHQHERLWRSPRSSRKRRRFTKNFLQNFGDLSQFWGFWWFWYRLQNFEKSLVTLVTPYWDKFFKILTFEFWWNRKVMINHRGGILIFCQILSKLKILDFRVKDF